MTLTGPACVSRLAKLVIGISLPTFDLGFKTWLRAYVGRPRTGNRYLNCQVADKLKPKLGRD
jgi:hypothetical protein